MMSAPRAHPLFDFFLGHTISTRPHFIETAHDLINLLGIAIDVGRYSLAGEIGLAAFCVSGQGLDIETSLSCIRAPPKAAHPFCHQPARGPQTRSPDGRYL